MLSEILPLGKTRIFFILQHIKNVLCAVRYNIIIQHKPKKCTFSKLIFYFLISMSCTCFEPEGSSSGRRLYIQLWYDTFEHTVVSTRLLTLLHVQHTIPYHNCIYIRLPEDEPSGSKHVEDIKN